MGLREETFGDRLREARECAGLTQEQAADRCGISAAAISHYECGQREPTLTNLTALCGGLLVSADWLMGLQG